MHFYAFIDNSDDKVLQEWTAQPKVIIGCIRSVIFEINKTFMCAEVFFLNNQACSGRYDDEQKIHMSVAKDDEINNFNRRMYLQFDKQVQFIHSNTSHRFCVYEEHQNFTLEAVPFINDNSMRKRVGLLSKEISKPDFGAYSFFVTNGDYFISKLLYHHVRDNEPMFIAIGVCAGAGIILFFCAMFYMYKQKQQEEQI